VVREDWTTVYETHKRIDADQVRTTLERTGFQVVERGDPGLFVDGPPTNFAGFIGLAVPPEDADDARTVLKDQLRSEEEPDGGGGPISVAQAADAVLAVRADRAVAAASTAASPPWTCAKTSWRAGRSRCFGRLAWG
jgi:hypothetical protein